MNNLNNKKILLIICGGIAAYKSLEIIRLLKKSGVTIKTILTKSGAEFVTPLSITSLSQSKVYQDLFSIENEVEMDHISLSRWADLILIAPATANTISKLASGSSDDLASTVAPSILGLPISVFLSSFKSKTLLNLIVSPTLALSFSISKILLADTLYCFPPVSIIANDINSLFLISTQYSLQC